MKASADALRDQFAACELPHSAAQAALLKARVCAFVDGAKALGWPPERVIIALKQLARESGIGASRNIVAANALLLPRDQLLMDAVRWCIERYYDGDRA